MNKKETGGPAFPRPLSGARTDLGFEFSDSQAGMTLRDWFAGQVLGNQNLVGDEGGTIADAKKELSLTPNESYDYRIHWPMIVAKRAYAYADAMLSERNKESSHD